MGVTNGVLAAKIDSIHEKLDSMNKRIDKIELNEEKNTEFRNKAIGITVVVTAIGGFMGSLAMWVISKVWR